jgi:hypothetical protein
MLAFVGSLVRAVPVVDEPVLHASLREQRERHRGRTNVVLVVEVAVREDGDPRACRRIHGRINRLSVRASEHELDELALGLAQRGSRRLHVSEDGTQLSGLLTSPSVLATSVAGCGAELAAVETFDRADDGSRRLVLRTRERRSPQEAEEKEG